ncbi:hypothetical protein BAQU_0329 [Bifidobacterium aquikefiri]|uniref:DUF3073 domain-containing protein n=1 Tax=Bifidobacterium aquikefiri TaxID=1653207 RepID=A0A261GAP9_9BIFI|nr:hypothetical protein BAQU_0329 [Bifidobacterium aquikefiri]
MGRGRQKAKQTKIARKLKYLTTDTDYDELAKELRHEEADTNSVDPFIEDSKKYNRDESDSSHNHSYNDDADEVNPVDDDLDDYAKWAAQAAAKATTGEIPATPKVHKPIPMPVPSMLHHRSSRGNDGEASPVAVTKKSKTATSSGHANDLDAQSKSSEEAKPKARSKASAKAGPGSAAKTATRTKKAKVVKKAKATRNPAAKESSAS